MPNSRLSQLLGISAVSIVAGLPLAHAQQGTAPSPATQAFTPPQPTPNDTLVSPEVSSDGHVTFRLYAPGAKKVMLQSEGLSPLPGSPRLRTEFGPSTSVQSNREYTGTAFSVDGVQTVDTRLRRMHDYTPPGYERGAQSYPVLYLLHGGGDTHDSWPTVGRAGAILDNLIAEKKSVPMIVVMPAAHVSRTFQLRTGQNTNGSRRVQ